MSLLSDAFDAVPISPKLIRERVRAYSALPNPNPLFIFGNQKSGTTAFGSLLAAATGRSVTLDFAGAKEPFATRLYRGSIALDAFMRKNAWAFSTDIIKEPALTFVAPQLMAHLPGARAIAIVRDPFNNIRSILDRLKLRGDLPALDVAATKLNSTWRAILQGRQFGADSEHYVSALAERWLRAASIGRSLQARCTLVRYEDFNAAKTATVERLAREAGFTVLNNVAHLQDRDFQRRAAARLTSTREFFGAENFARIQAICGETAGLLGYEIPGAETSGQSASGRATPVLRPISALS